MRRFSIVVFFLLSVTVAKAQVGINILIPDSSAVLQLEAPNNNKGLGLTRLSTPQMNSVWNPLDGLTIFNTNDSLIEYWNGECWLKAYQKNCYECEFNMSLSHNTDTIDRTVVDSAFTTLTINQTNGSQIIDISYVGLPPAGVQIYTLGNMHITNGSDSLKIVVKADVFATGGLVPIMITAVCDDKIRVLTYNVYIKPCVQVTIPMDVWNYNLQIQNGIQLPPGARECVVVNVYPSVEITSAMPTAPAYSTGNLHPLSIVGIINNGYIFGRGGDGGSLTGTVAGGVAGQDGGDAMLLSTRTVINNYGGIYGGGGGGASIGLLFSTSVPIVGTLTIGAGVGGGGGSASGLGGTTTAGGIAVGLFYDGTDATAGHNSVPGTGNGVALPVSITYSGVGIMLTPNGGGGDGGAFGQPGTQGSLGLCVSIVGIPIIGTINLGCFNAGVGPNGGQPGLAIKRNNHPLTNIADGVYNNNQIKGRVAP